MADQKKNLNNLVSFSGTFISQLLFGLFLTIVFLLSGQEASVSIFLGVVGALALGMIVSANKNRPQPQSLASSEGIDAGLRYWLVFLIGFSLIGYQAPMSILLGAIAGVGGGWMTAWWESKEETRTQLPDSVSDGDEDTDLSTETSNTKRRKRKPIRRYRRTPGSTFRFWGR